MKFIIFKVKNGYLMNVTRNKKITSYVFVPKERLTMLAMIDSFLGEDPKPTAKKAKPNTGN